MEKDMPVPCEVDWFLQCSDFDPAPKHAFMRINTLDDRENTCTDDFSVHQFGSHDLWVDILLVFH